MANAHILAYDRIAAVRRKTIYGHGLSLGRRVGCAFALHLDVGVHAQPERQTLTGIQFNERLENFGVHALARFVGAHVLPAENAPNANDVSGEFPRAVRLGGNKSWLANAEAGNVSLVNVETN